MIDTLDALCSFSYFRFCAISYTSIRSLKLKSGSFMPIRPVRFRQDSRSARNERLLSLLGIEKRLAMELISRTMQDMHHHQTDHQCDSLISEPTFIASSTNKYEDSSSLVDADRFSPWFSLYWPYKCWQRQQQLHAMPRIASVLDSRCERATSPLRLVTPARRPTTTANAFNPMERPPTRNASHRLLSSVLLRAKPSPTADQPEVPRLSSQLCTPASSDSPSRRDYHVTTSLGNFSEEDDRSVSSFLRGKTPLV